MKKVRSISLCCLFALLLIGCKSEDSIDVTEPSESNEKVGVLLVNHGSHSPTWRQMLLDVEDNVREEILANPRITELKTAFMEYNEPSIATQMKWFDENGFTDVIIVPIFLTVSSHYSHDIPVIVGLSSDPKITESLAEEEIEVYKSKARATITPPLDYTTLLKKNVARRVEALSDDSDNEAVLLVAYGDEQYNQQWEEMVEEIGQYLKIKTGHEMIAYAWCGHIVEYSSDPTTEGIEKLFEFEDNVIVIPVLVANDEHFQGEIIQDGVNAASNTSHVKYIKDAILPHKKLEQRVVKILFEKLETIRVADV
ncbi:MAG: cobalamin biosynthesis protein CbiX [Crocinitomicaceae bacterium]|nr:cobalamin biosynthesis protein CbiX [Crocinitomicaceae bacterium]